LAKEKGVPREKVKSWMPFPGGAPANVATCLAKLGQRTSFVSALGRDERGEELMQLLSESGVDTSAVQRVDAPTRDVYVERTTTGDRVFAGFGMPTEQYCDCFLDATAFPDDLMSVSKCSGSAMGMARLCWRAACGLSTCAFT
jgi:fructokinase